MSVRISGEVGSRRQRSLLRRLAFSRPDLVVAIALFVGLCLVLVPMQRGTTPTYDASIYMEVATNIVDNGSLEVRNDPYLFNTPYSSYGLGLSIVIIPFYLVQKAVQPGGQEAMLLINVIMVAASSVVLFAIGRQLRLSRSASIVPSLIFGLLTMAPQQSTDLFTEPGVTLFILSAIFGLLLWRGHRRLAPLLVGTAIGAAITFRADSVLLCGVVLLTIPLFVPFARLWVSRLWILLLGAPLLLAMIYQLAYNAFRYNSLFGRVGYEGQTFDTPFWTGFYGNVLSPGKGFFVFNAVLVLGLPGIVLLWKRDRAVAVAISLLSIARPLFYARWSSWEAGVGWGPRFMFPLCALLAIPAALSIRAVANWAGARRAVGATVIGVLVTTSAACTMLSVSVPFEQWFNVVTGNAGVTQTPEVSDRRVHDYYWTFSGNHITGNVKLIDEARPFPLRWFADDRRVFGASLLVLGGGLLIGTAAFGRRSDEFGEEPPLVGSSSSPVDVGL